MDVNTYSLFQVNKELDICYQKEYPGKEAHWLTAQGYLDASLAWRRTPRATHDLMPMWLSAVFLSGYMSWAVHVSTCIDW